MIERIEWSKYRAYNCKHKFKKSREMIKSPKLYNQKMFCLLFRKYTKILALKARRCQDLFPDTFFVTV